MNNQNQNENTNLTLTENEKICLDSFRSGMDCPNEGYLHEIAPFEGKKLSGIVSSMVQKGIIDVQVIKEYGISECHWVVVNKPFAKEW